MAAFHVAVKACIRPSRDPRNLTRLYRIVVEVIYLTLLVSLITADVFPKASLPKASFSLLQTPS
jgi:hypothetical protein